MRRHYKHGTKTLEKKLFRTIQKKFGLHTTLLSKDEIEMKLRLGLFAADISQHFGISGGPCTQVFCLSMLGVAEYFQSFVYKSDMETIVNMVSTFDINK